MALFTAMNKKLNNKKDGVLTEITAEVKDELMELESSTGINRKAIKVNGVKVGEVGINYTRPRPYILPGHEEEAYEALLSMGLAHSEVVPNKDWDKHFIKAGGDFVIDAETGEPIDWLGWMPQAPKSAAVRGCEPDDVVEAFAGKLDSAAITALLEG